MFYYDKMMTTWIKQHNMHRKVQGPHVLRSCPRAWAHAQHVVLAHTQSRCLLQINLRFRHFPPYQRDAGLLRRLLSSAPCLEPVKSTDRWDEIPELARSTSWPTCSLTMSPCCLLGSSSGFRQSAGKQVVVWTRFGPKPKDCYILRRRWEEQKRRREKRTRGESWVERKEENNIE